MSDLPSIYFDNAATTRMDERVLESMMPYFTSNFGNPSSVHSHGRNARVELEKARKKIAGLLHASPGEITFTSGGTEADNTAILGAIAAYDIQHIITSPLEHHAVLHVVEQVAKSKNIRLSLLTVDKNGTIDLNELEELLQNKARTMVSLMHGNNEIGNVSDLKTIADLCQRHSAYFHSDTVQTVGHYPLDLQSLPVHAIAGSAHKFHGPKGVGFLYTKKNKKIPPMIAGGSQERNMRGGTENIAAIIGMAKALEIAVHHQTLHREEIVALKKYFKKEILAAIPGIVFNGLSGDLENSLYTVLNISFPPSDTNQGMLLFHLDLAGISASGGSACSSGARLGSHVLQGIGADASRENVRFSFSRFNTREEVDYTVNQLKELYA
ncbi:cysteine desulfurase family protein [Cyclobacterium plantarum]|uniref:cysteine desulfurase n=1 Tax=Cyclobacterium plantarum TaxID=2716263 RepID=A0ABX0H496_9BACT|nr:cysteine desulfurase family protein [Cyclobacterium plantarum]NHE55292.1 cysteine desulfurase [Cyclobacterium plantarum]